MSSSIKVFICYKKILSRERDGKIIEKENVQASILYNILAQAEGGRYEPWVDDSGLPAGVEWEKMIYDHLLISDVLLVLIGPGTSQSEWVGRELALASALGIYIIPLGFDLNKNELVEEQKALNIDHLQGKVTQNIKLAPSSAAKALLNELQDDIEHARQQTKANQEKTFQMLLARRNPPTPKADDKQKASTFVLDRNGRTHNLHIASGDLAKVKNIDVLVNSENDYMQMARFFESRTVSSMLRRRGAQVQNGKYEDTIQRELDWQLREHGRPVQAATVFATSAGGPNSELARTNKARYIFHVAAVQAVAAQNTVVPYKQPEQIEDCACKCLEKLVEINELNGVISPPDTEQRKEQERLAAEGRGLVRSIIFPLFGTGQGGCATTDVLEPMLSGITGFLDNPDYQDQVAVLSDIYISVFKEQDLNIVLERLRAKFPER